MNFNGSDPLNVYFLNSAEDTYKSNYIMNLIFLVSLKILWFLFMKLENRMEEKNKDRQSFLRVIVSALKYNSKCWCMLVACL